MTLYSYVITVDDGNAPHLHSEMCSLAVCKPKIRSAATIGDWIVGTNPLRLGPHYVVYAMQVSETASFQQYWFDYPERRPSPRNPQGDNMYRPVGDGLKQVNNCSHGPEDQLRDTRTNRVLLGHRYYYFGAKAKKLPAGLRSIVKQGQGHKSKANDSDESAFITWLTSHYEEGTLGNPRDAPCTHPSGSLRHTLLRHSQQ